jgi:hypothetical protein
MAGPISANAQSTNYTYQADNLAGAINIRPPAGATSFTVPSNVEVGPLNGFIILSAPLGDNLNNVSVTPTFVDISSGNSALFYGVFAFSTNGSGAIDGWSMSLNGTVYGPGGYTFTATSADFGGKGGDSSATSFQKHVLFFPREKQQPRTFRREIAIDKLYSSQPYVPDIPRRFQKHESRLMKRTSQSPFGIISASKSRRTRFTHLVRFSAILNGIKS